MYLYDWRDDVLLRISKKREGQRNNKKEESHCVATSSRVLRVNCDFVALNFFYEHILDPKQKKETIAAGKFRKKSGKNVISASTI